MLAGRLPLMEMEVQVAHFIELASFRVPWHLLSRAHVSGELDHFQTPKSLFKTIHTELSIFRYPRIVMRTAKTKTISTDPVHLL